MRYIITAVVAGLLASVAAAPTPTIDSENGEIVMTHTVAIDEIPAAPAPTDLGVSVGYGFEPAPEAQDGIPEVGYSSSSVVPSSTPTSTDCEQDATPVTPARQPASAAAMAAGTPANAHASGVAVDPASEHPANALQPAPSASAIDQPAVPVVPVRICTHEDRAMCLTTFGSEFANVKLSFDNVAEFSLGVDGLLVRLSDLKCADAVPMDDATWYDLSFNNCTLPNYLVGALQLPGNGIDAPATDGQEQDVAGEDRAEKLTASVSSKPAATPAPTPSADPIKREQHTVWTYNASALTLCANVNDGLNEVVQVCMYSDEGYVQLQAKENLNKLSAEDREIYMPVVDNANITLGEELANMITAMTYDGTVFWADAWSTNIETVMKYKMMGVEEEDVDMSRDEINGVVYPLWQVINDCRSLCDIYAFCHSFTFHVYERVCRLSSASPDVAPDKLDKKSPDLVYFAQNTKYAREDFVLPEDIIYDTPATRKLISAHVVL